MSRVEQAVADREVGQYPMSIGTSLALEGAFGIYPEREENYAPIRNYNGLWVNISTLFRNLFNSLPSKLQDEVTDKELTTALASDINALQGVMETEAYGKIQLVFYMADKRSLSSKLKHATLRVPSTDKQKIYKSIHDATIKKVLNLISVDVRFFDVDVLGKGTSLILTHYPVDLLSYHYFDKLALLESHTGRIKGRYEWGSKLTPRDDTMPFNQFTLQVFGDSTDIVGKSIKYKRPLTEIMKRDRWAPSSSSSKQKASIKAVSDNDVKEYLTDIMKDSSF